jgi:hypothetical protein
MRCCWGRSLSQLSCAPVQSLHAPRVLVSDLVDISAGIEVAVAATKTFLGQMRKFFGLATPLPSGGWVCRRAAPRHAGVLAVLMAGLKAVQGTVLDKVLSNAQEAKASDAQLSGFAPAGRDTQLFVMLLRYRRWMTR